MNSGMRKLVFFVLTIGLAYAAYHFMIRPANLHLKDQKAILETKTTKLQELQKASLAADDMTKQLGRVEEAIKVFESRLPSTNQIYTVLENVTLIAQKHGLNQKTIRTLKSNENHGYVEQPLRMELDGDFNSYYAFLLELEKLDRITKIKEMYLKKKSKTEGQTDATFVVSIFFQNGGA